MSNINPILLLISLTTLIFAPIIIVLLLASSKLLRNKLTRVYSKYEDMDKDIVIKVFMFGGFRGIIRLFRISI